MIVIKRKEDADVNVGRKWKQYKKRPVIVLAIKMPHPFMVFTKEGVLKGKPWDYLIEGVEGELYPCDERIFHKTYQQIEKEHAMPWANGKATKATSTG